MGRCLALLNFLQVFSRKIHPSHSLEPIRYIGGRFRRIKPPLTYLTNSDDTDQKLPMSEACYHRAMLSKPRPASCPQTSDSRVPAHQLAKMMFAFGKDAFGMYLVFLPPNHPALPPAQLPRTNSSPQSALPHHSHPKSSV